MHRNVDISIGPYKPQADFRPECDATLPARPRHGRGRPAEPILEQHAPCEQCGGDVPKRATEGVSAWLRRKFCSHPCSTARHRDLTAEKRALAAKSLAEEPPLGAPPQANSLPPDCFAAHNLALRSGGACRVSRPPTHVETGSPLGDA